MYVRNSSKKRKYLIVKLFGTRSCDGSLYVCCCRYNGCINSRDVHIKELLVCEHDASPSLVVKRVLTTQANENEDQRSNIFQTRAGINGKSIKVVIDGGSCHNLASTELCEKLNLTLHQHKHPYHIQWLSDQGSVKIKHTVSVTFSIGPYKDT